MDEIKKMFYIRGKSLFLIYYGLDILNYDGLDTENVMLSQLILMLHIAANTRKV